jgi:hypothetical protein
MLGAVHRVCSCWAQRGGQSHAGKVRSAWAEVLQQQSGLVERDSCPLSVDSLAGNARTMSAREAHAVSIIQSL